MRGRVRFWLHGPLLPLLAVQGWRTRRRIPNLPEADGPFEGVIGEGAPLSLAVVGESTAAGVGVDRQEDALAFALAREIARRHARAVSVQVVGRNGANLRTTREELVPRLRLPVDCVFVVTGVNDALELTRGAVWRNELRKTIEHLRARGAREIVFSAMPPLGELPTLPQPTRSALGARAAYLDQVLADACAQWGARYLSVRFPNRQELIARDGFHPSAVGYAEWAAALAANWPISQPPQPTQPTQNGS